MLFDAVGTRLNNTDKTNMLNVVRTILLGIVVLSCLDNIAVTDCEYQTCCKLIFADLLQVDITDLLQD